MRRRAILTVGLLVRCGPPAAPQGADTIVVQGHDSPSSPPTGTKTGAEDSRLGLVTARFTIDLRSTSAGELVELRAGIGDHVERGDVVAVLVDADLEHSIRSTDASAATAAARLDDANLVREFARDRARRIGALAPYVSGDEQLEARHAEARALAAARTARRDLGEDRAVQDRLRARKDALVLRAPFAAEVAASHLDPGQRVLADQPIVRLVSRERIVRFAIDHEVLDRFSVGTAVTFVSAVDGATSSLRIIAIAPEIDAAGMVLVEAGFVDPAAEMGLRSGTRGLVRRDG